MTQFVDEQLVQILEFVEAGFEAGERTVRFLVPNPELSPGRYAGERVELDSVVRRHRPMRVWTDLAERLRARLRVPRVKPGGMIELEFERLNEDNAWHLRALGENDKYDPGAEFGRIRKSEDPYFIADLRDALSRVEPEAGARVLDLGINDGDELLLMRALNPALRSASFVGVDRNAAAIGAAELALAGVDVALHVADLAELPDLDLGTFDLVVCIATLQSPSIDDREVLRHVVQQRLRPGASLILGMPNSTYVDGEVLFGAKMKNFRQAELSLVVKELAFYKRYLQQHRFRVFITGKNDLLLTAIPR